MKTWRADDSYGPFSVCLGMAQCIDGRKCLEVLAVASVLHGFLVKIQSEGFFLGVTVAEGHAPAFC